ncbi:MAG TPA: ATP-binding protein [Magnetospirillum sp.]|nr:ATP-binding protein [Magnetospirillum sp.]
MILPATVIDGLDCGVIVLDAQRRVGVWNAWMADRSGIAAADAIGKDIVEVFPSLAGSYLLAAVQRALGNRLSTVMSHNLHPRVLPLFSRDGSRVEPLEQSVVVRPMAEGAEPDCLIQVTDITAAVKRDRHLRDVTVYNRTLFEMAVDPMATVARDGSLLDVNPAFEVASGVPRQGLLGTPFNALFTVPDDADRLIAAALADGRVRDVLLSMRQGGGALRHVSVSAASLQEPADDHGAVFLVARDLTDRIEAERELAQKTRIIERSNAELEQFAYAVSHDLRQPLRTVSSYVSLVERRLDGNVSDDIREFIGFAVDGTRRMDRLIVDLLNYSRIGRQEAPLERLDLGEVVGEVLANLRTAIVEANAEVTISPRLPAIRGRRRELVRLFQNLIGNAIQYAAPDRKPVIAIECHDVGAAWVMSVHDNGIGIAPDNQERIFGLFQRLPDTENTEGTGIGLAVCRKIAESHQGRIWVESVPGQGSTFFFALPKQ